MPWQNAPCALSAFFQTLWIQQRLIADIAPESVQNRLNLLIFSRMRINRSVDKTTSNSLKTQRLFRQLKRFNSALVRPVSR
jgi:hypothetical protein